MSVLNNYIPTLKLISHFFVKQSFLPLPKKTLLNFCFISFLSLTTLFYQYICVYQETYINRLKGVYPTTFLETNGKVVDPLSGFRHEPEVFELSSSILFSFSANSDISTFIDIGIRAVSPEHSIDPVLSDVVTQELSVSANQALYEQLKTTPGFDGSGIYLISRGGERYYVKIVPLDLPGEKAWMIMSTALASDLGFFPNVTSVYPEKAMPEHEVVEFYSKSGLLMTIWSDRLPFFSSVFHVLLSSVFRWMMTGTLVLIMILNIGFIKDTLREFKKLINFANLYGVDEFIVQMSFSVLLTGWFVALYSFSYVFKIILNAYLAHAVPTIGELLVPAFYPGVLAAIILVLNLTILINIRTLYRRKLVLAGG